MTTTRDDWEYDSESKTIWVDCKSVVGQTLIGRDELQPYIEILTGRATVLPGPVDAVKFVFADTAAARYNRDSLSFARIRTYLVEDGIRKPLDMEGEPDFEAREDFGIE